MEIVEEARGRTKMSIEVTHFCKKDFLHSNPFFLKFYVLTFRCMRLFQEKKRKLAREKKSTIIDEDNPIFLKKTISIMIMKLFADLERKRKGHEDKISEDAQKKRDMEDEIREKKEMRETYAKNWEESRQGR